jgi:hypothetical protein
MEDLNWTVIQQDMCPKSPLPWPCRAGQTAGEEMMPLSGQGSLCPTPDGRVPEVVREEEEEQ